MHDEQLWPPASAHLPALVKAPPTLKLPMALSAKFSTSRLVLVDRQSPMTRTSLRAMLSSRSLPKVLRPSRLEMLLSASHRT